MIKAALFVCFKKTTTIDAAKKKKMVVTVILSRLDFLLSGLANENL